MRPRMTSSHELSDPTAAEGPTVDELITTADASPDSITFVNAYETDDPTDPSLV